MGVSFVCPNCNNAVDPTKPNAMMSAATKQWQHKDCAQAPPRRDSSPQQPQQERRRRPRR